MTKKSFKDNPAMDYLSYTQDKREEKDVFEESKGKDKEETQDTPASKKREKAPRINMAFKPKNLEYLRVVSRLKGYTITDYINYLVEADMAEGDNVQLLKEAESFLKRVSKTNSKQGL